MSPTQRNIAIAIALLGLAFWGYKQQLHLPKPSLNPFDDQWEMRMPWLKTNCDSIVKGYCSDFSYEFSQGSFRVGYASLVGDEGVIRGKMLLVVADTIQLTRNKKPPLLWSISRKYSENEYVENLNFKRLDSVCSTFGYARINHLIIPPRPNPHFHDASYPEESYPRYWSESTGDTISFSIISRFNINDSLLVRDFYYLNGRVIKTYLKENQVYNL
ncbi:MAG: hypothetical protein AB8F78_13670 [Saprospiraceae bacterium]